MIFELYTPMVLFGKKGLEGVAFGNIYTQNKKFFFEKMLNSSNPSI